MKTYTITLEQLSALSEFISGADDHGHDGEACSEAHQIVIAVLNDDARLVYAPLEEPEAAA